MTVIEEFTKCLNTLSQVRAGWDFDLPKAQRQDENRQEKEALARARAIWIENPNVRDDLRTAFTAASPLASMREIEFAA